MSRVTVQTARNARIVVPSAETPEWLIEDFKSTLTNPKGVISITATNGTVLVPVAAVQYVRIEDSAQTEEDSE